MHRSLRTRAGLLAAAAVLTPALAATPALAGPGHHRDGRDDAPGLGGRGHHGDHGGRGDHGSAPGVSLAAVQAKLVKVVGRVGDQVDRAVSDRALRGLDADAVTALRANAAADHAALDDLATQAAAATDAAGLQAVFAGLKAYRPDAYRFAAQAVRATARLGADVTELTTTLADDPDAQTALADAQTALDAARSGALALHATSTRDDVVAVRTSLQDARDLLEPYADQLA
ncbi:hypothetical protein K8Z61_16590 [Nocardioides sp. TRM66260-LWL]|uniref:hypothetical protein n=1 Tax=Nocardioides sp. TRM66260-LWL TaxID=2874478 RepID=UPI001CC4941D|nr:hypothetical protein [Nocardioides sp. TRM66260-LWL]MBZ5736113.1 hypothetical protein [Nocardioides sp. TRM66260-LWL]